MTAPHLDCGVGAVDGEAEVVCGVEDVGLCEGGQEAAGPGQQRHYCSSTPLHVCTLTDRSAGAAAGGVPAVTVTALTRVRAVSGAGRDICCPATSRPATRHCCPATRPAIHSGKTTRRLTAHKQLPQSKVAAERKDNYLLSESNSEQMSKFFVAKPGRKQVFNNGHLNFVSPTPPQRGR